MARVGTVQRILVEGASRKSTPQAPELSGRTEPGAALIINGESVADIHPDGTFKYFTQSLGRGSHSIAITGQNRRGGTVIKHVEIVIP